MVRTRVSNKEIPHLWLYRGSQQYAEANSQYFSGDKFYSYSTQIGYLLRKDGFHRAVILDRTKYSVTTSRHQTKLAWACNDVVTIFEYEKGQMLYKTPEEITPDDLYNYYQEQAVQLQLKAKKARSNKIFLIQKAKDYIKKCNQVIYFFNSEHLERIDESQLDELLEELSIKELETQKIREEKAQIKLAVQLEKDKEDFFNWLDGKGTFPSSYNSKGIFLRTKGDKVETSRGVTFPLHGCETLYRLYKRSIKEDKVYCEPYKIGIYTVDSISKKGIKAGCHYIQPEEIERFASSIGLED